MQTALTSATSATSSQVAKTPSKELDKNAFLMLLVAQLQNQDPTSAQDPNAMIQQMTSFSSLEQMQNTNKLLEGIQLQNQGLFQAQAAGMVGKRVRVTSSSLDLKAGAATMGLDLAADAKVTITIKDARGDVVQVIEKGSMSAGSHLIDWNGRDALGGNAPDGTYTVSISATDAAGKAVTATPSAYARVDAVSFLEGTVYIVAGGRRFSLSDIHEITA